MLCQFLLCNSMNQLHVYIYPIPLKPLSHHPRSQTLGCHRAPSWAPCARQQLPASRLFYPGWCINVYVSASLLIFPTLPFLPCFYISVLQVCVSITALQIGSSLPFFQILYVCVCVFFWGGIQIRFIEILLDRYIS